MAGGGGCLGSETARSGADDNLCSTFVEVHCDSEQTAHPLHICLSQNAGGHEALKKHYRTKGTITPFPSFSKHIHAMMIFQSQKICFKTGRRGRHKPLLNEKDFFRLICPHTPCGFSVDSRSDALEGRR